MTRHIVRGESRRFRRLAGATVMFVAAVGATALAHVGTSNAYFEGPAGPYGVRVIVRTPGVVPGLAQISVRVTEGTGVERVTVRPLRWDVGLEGAPPADVATPVTGEPDLYAAELWLMTASSYSVHVTVSGEEGEGTAFVPVMAVAERRLDMHPAMAVGLIGAAVFLFVGAVTVFGAAVRESVLEPGVPPDAKRQRRGHWAMSVGGVGLALLLWGGWSWWDAVDRVYRSRIYRPLSTSAAMTVGEKGRVLTLTIDDPSWEGRGWTPLMPDHGKLMHMFLVREDDFGAFAHVHPAAIDSKSFAVLFPPLPEGEYTIYADIVHESGFAQTLVDTIDTTVETEGGVEHRPALDPDDSWATLMPLGTATGTSYPLPSGRVIQWDRETFPVADEETTLRFTVLEADGRPATLEPYMGMLSHAAITRDDGAVFMHVHPVGTINLAAQMRFEREEGGIRTSEMHTGHPSTAQSVTLPFVFPRPGTFRVFVQVKVAGTVETAAFDVEVAPAV